MRLPRDLTGTELARRLGRVGYTVTRQTGSHMRLTCAVQGEHHVTVPRHDPLRLGTLAAILDAVAAHRGVSREALLDLLFER
ncbi:type II toxin-antitoxin system HicA family toxin [Acidithiobacillus ferriphilus]|uniref:type II toxin-antitoxin system HicA family toxin n=1 Tax=Acidithiobacillus ferriphilus TaxID=1689834 RepID=UPI001C05F32B|nr:type II toxin-antitoxin system HicA family toxin [Acidithiobacillus ferriphilus]MBU2786572.1 type II toxin-antitoxin system HicA family toxin [Acidithiobacillus ferriphilus]